MSSEPGRRYRWTVLLIACIGSLMGPMDSTIVSTTLPVISDSLKMSYSEVIWVPTAYLVTIAVLLLSMGRLSDIKGRKWLYISGFGVFVLGSFLCSISANGTEIVLFRVVQGVGAALIMSTSTALVTDVFPAQERGKALGINAMFVYVGLSLGPALGGFLTGILGWRSIFWVNIPIGLVVMALAAWIIIEKEGQAIGKGFDASGALVFAIALVSVLLLLTLGEESGWTSLPMLLLLGSFLVSIFIFIRIERGKGDEAMLDLRLLTENRLFAMANISALLNYTAFYGVNFIISFYLQRVLDLSLIQTGLVLLVMPVVMAILSPISGWMSDRFGSRALATAGMMLISVGMLLLSTLTIGSSVDNVMVALVVLGTGMGLFSSPNTSAVMGSVREDQHGVASGTISTMRTIGQSLSLAIMGAVIAMVATPDILSSIFVNGSDMSTILVTEEFVHGMQMAFIVSAILAMIGALTSSARPSFVQRSERKV
jgi:EmrB/QacA subfamily drug resistance transporter